MNQPIGKSQCSRLGYRAVVLGCACVSLVLAGTEGLSQVAGGSPGLSPIVLSGTYDWGTREYDEEFTDHFDFDNVCDRPVVVTFDTRGVPFLTVMPRVDAAPGSNQIPVTLTTPPWPDRPQCTDLTGALVVQSTGYETATGVCHPSERTFTVSAHVHWWDRPPPPPKLKIAAPDACTVWWNTGQRPSVTPSPSEEQCLEPMRALAQAYREWLLLAAAGRDAEWTWLPSDAQTAALNISELLAMKQRADRQLGLQPQGG